MNSIPVPKNELGRLSALKLYDILDTEAEQEFDNLAQLAAEICNAPIALINLIDESRQWTKAAVGMDAKALPREVSFCYYTILDDEIFEVTNPLADARFLQNPWVTGQPGVRFYAGVPLVNKEGFRLGTLCVMSPKHHQLNSYQRISLQILASAVMSLLELKREQKEAAFYKKALDEVSVVTLLDRDNTIIGMNEWFCQLAGLKPEEIIGRGNNDIKLADLSTEQTESIAGSLKEKKIWKGIVKNQNIKGAISWCELTIIPFVSKDAEIIRILYLRRDITEEILLRERLEESETLAKTGRWELNIFNRSTTWTPGMFALLDGDTGNEKITAQTIMNFISPLDFDRVSEANKKLLEKKSTGDQIDFRIVTPSGRQKDIHAVVKKRFNNKGGLTGIFGTLMDVTEKRRMELEIARLKLEKEELYNTSATGYFSVNSKGKIIKANRTAAAWLGYHLADLVDNTSLKDIVVDESMRMVEAWLVTLAFQGTVYEPEVTFRRKDGQMFYGSVNGKHVIEDNHGVYEYTIQDISPVKVLQDKISELSEQHARSEFQEDQMVFVVDLNGAITRVSPAFEKITGKSEKEMRQKPFVFALNDEWKLKAVNFYTRQITNQEETTVFVLPILGEDGEKIWMELAGKLIKSDHVATSVKCVLTDVTSRVKTEDALHEVAWIAMEAKDMQQTVMERMRHDVRNPMEGVVGMVNLLSTTNLTLEQRVLVGGIKDSANEMLGTLDTIFDTAKLQPMKLHKEDTEFEVKSLVNNIVFTLKPDAEEKNIQFTLQVDNKIPLTVIAERDVLSKILMILTSNAIRYTEKGSVGIGVFQKSQENDMLTLEFVVKDTGIGIPPEKLEIVFETFVHEERDPRELVGSGLGLAVAKQLVEQQGGEIKVKSQVGIGTTFSFTYLCKLSQDAAMPLVEKPDDSDETKGLAGYHILLVEDNIMNQRIARVLLENWGAKVTTTDRGRKAIDLVAGNNYDVILMDVQMPEMSGIEATTSIRQDLIDNTPIMGMTVSEMQASRETCIRAGMNDYILKPLKPEELHRKVFALLNKPEAKLKEMPPVTGYVKEKITNINYLKSITSNDIHLIKEILEIYINKTPALLEELEVNMANRNYRQAQAGAHYLKNSVGLIGADTLFHMFASFENQLNLIPPSSDTYDLLGKLKSIIMESIDETEAELKLL